MDSDFLMPILLHKALFKLVLKHVICVDHLYKIPTLLKSKSKQAFGK